MSKEAKTNLNEIHPLLKTRWSPRAFEDKPVEAEKLRNILEAARWSPSASNIQPWIFFPGLKGDENYDKITSTLVEFNQMWTKFAPVLILNCGKITNDDGDPYGTWQYDTGQSVAHLSMQAMQEGLHVHQMSGFDALKAAELFALPEDVQAVSVTAIGYLGDPSMLHPRMQKSELAERERKEMDTFVFSGIYGRASEIVE
jgi:nitroreductase